MLEISFLFRYVSGVAIFCTDKSVQENFHKKLLRMRREDQPSDMYRSIVIGNPIKEMTHFQGAIKLENSPLTREKKVYYCQISYFIFLLFLLLKLFDTDNHNFIFFIIIYLFFERYSSVVCNFVYTDNMTRSLTEITKQVYTLLQTVR